MLNIDEANPTCRTLLYSASDIPSLGEPSVLVQDGITVDKRLYREQSPDRAIMSFSSSVWSLTSCANKSAKLFLASDPLGLPMLYCIACLKEWDFVLQKILHETYLLTTRQYEVKIEPKITVSTTINVTSRMRLRAKEKEAVVAAE